MEHVFDGERPPRARKVLRIVGISIGGVALACLFGLAFGWLVMMLWNRLMPSLFGLPVVTYWQGFGLVVLAKILFSGIGHHGSDQSRHIHNKVDRRWHKWLGVNDDDIGNPGGDHGNWRHYPAYWKKEGKAAFEAYLEKMRTEKPSE